MNKASADYEWKVWHGRNPVRRWWKRALGNEIARQLHSLPHHIVLDCGCGSSPSVQCYKGRKVVFDLLPHKVGYLQERADVSALAASVLQLPAKNASVDRIVINEVIEHLPEPERCLSEASRALKHHGIMVVATPDSSTRLWRTIERLDTIINRGGHCEDHCQAMDPSGLSKMCQKYQLYELKRAWIARCDLVMSFVKLQDPT